MTIKQPFNIDDSVVSKFADVEDLINLKQCNYGNTFSAVVIGGGTGAPVSIRTLLSLGVQTSAIVAMADDGGSTGILREKANVTPPGDIRKCIAAFADDPYDPLVRAFKYRFAIANDHALGNLMLAALEDACGSFPEAIAICERMLNVQGHVYPSTLNHITLMAKTRDGRILDGQAVACHSKTALEQVKIESTDDLEICAYAPAIQAIKDADLIVLGPGSLFTSIIPNILVPGIIDAINKSQAKTLFVCSLADAQGETWGLTALEHVQALLSHGMEGLLDYVLVHSSQKLRADYSPNEIVAQELIESPAIDSDITEDMTLSGAVRPVEITYQDVQSIQETGALVITRNLRDEAHPTWHSPLALREAFLQVIDYIQHSKHHEK